MYLIQELDLSEKRNVYAVGDIHGLYEEFLKELEKIEFDKEQDVVIAVGDLVDRGRHSLKCTSLLDEDWFYSVRGNHEQTCIDAFFSKDMQMCNYHKRHGGEWFYTISNSKQKEVAHKFEKMPIMIEVKYKDKKYGFVHASLPYKNWNKNKRHLRHNRMTKNKQTISNYMMKDRSLFTCNDVIKIKNIDYVFFGHTNTREIKMKGNCIFIDTGAYRTKKFGIVKINE